MRASCAPPRCNRRRVLLLRLVICHFGLASHCTAGTALDPLLHALSASLHLLVLCDEPASLIEADALGFTEALVHICTALSIGESMCAYSQMVG